MGIKLMFSGLFLVLFGAFLVYMALRDDTALPGIVGVVMFLVGIARLKNK